MNQSSPEPGGPSASKVRFGVLAFVCSLSLLTYLDRVCIMRAERDIRGDLGLTPTEMGLVFSAFLLGYMLLEIPSGWMGDRWGARLVITRIVIWWSFFTALSGLVPAFDSAAGQPVLFGVLLPTFLNGFALLLAIRFLFGLGEAGAYPNLARVVGGWFPFGERGLAQGAIWMTARLGGAVAPSAFGFLMAWNGWRGAFWVLGIIGVVWAVIFYYWFRNTPEEKDACNVAERQEIRSGPYSFQADEARAGHAFPPWRCLVFNANVWALCVAAAGVSFGWYFFPTWQPEFFNDRFGITPKDSEKLTGLPFLCGAIGCFLGGGISDWLVRRTGSRRWGRSALGLIGFTGAGLCVLATGWVDKAWQATTLLCLGFFINDLAIPVIWAVSTDVGGRYAGTMAGVMNTAGGVGAVFSPVLIPQLREHHGWPTVFAVLAAGYLIAALAWLRIDASEPLVPDRPHVPPPPDEAKAKLQGAGEQIQVHPPLSPPSKGGDRGG